MRLMSSDGDVIRRGSGEKPRKAEDEMIKLQTEFREMHENVQRLTTEKMQLERDLDGIRKIAHRLEDEVNSLRSPPLIIGHLQDMISEKNAIVRSSNGTIFKVSVNPSLPNEKLKPGARVTLNQDTLAIIDVLQDGWDPLVTGAEVSDKPTITFDQIGGLNTQIELLREAIELPLTEPELFTNVGITPPKGVLLTGPPGCGKTMIAKAVAANADATFIQLVGSELAQKYIGEGGRLVRELFALAQEKAPSIIFIDEIDAIGAKRLDTATSGDREVQRTLMQLLAELDGFNPLDSVKIIAATNRPDILDDALLRPGRFDRIIEIPLPNEEARKGIFEINVKNMSTSNIKINSIINASEGYSGADIKAMCVEAGMQAIRARRKKVLSKDFTAALKITEKMRKDSESEKINTLYS